MKHLIQLVIFFAPINQPSFSTTNQLHIIVTLNIKILIPHKKIQKLLHDLSSYLLSPIHHTHFLFCYFHKGINRGRDEGQS